MDQESFKFAFGAKYEDCLTEGHLCVHAPGLLEYLLSETLRLSVALTSTR